jgi:hypothetical protein
MADYPPLDVEIPGAEAAELAAAIRTVLGIVGVAVGTSGAQTLANKILASPTVTGALTVGATAFGAIEIGRQDGTPTDAFIDFHTSTALVDYNARIIAQGDTALGLGILNFVCGALRLNGSQIFARSNILGTVSYSGGVPTGAIIESGSNPNGSWTKWADGRMECKFLDTAGQTTTDVSNGVYVSLTAKTWTFPQEFFSTDDIDVDVKPRDSLRWGSHDAPSVTSVNYRSIRGPSSGSAVAVELKATGRWRA